jgi:hypothetical protein
MDYPKSNEKESKYDIVPKPCKQILHFTQLKVYKMYIFPTYLPTQYKNIYFFVDLNSCFGAQQLYAIAGKVITNHNK